jgi:hypothetical protein
MNESGDVIADVEIGRGLQMSGDKRRSRLLWIETRFGS